jgi:hypothetical protein
MSYPYDGEQWGYQNHVILSDELIGFAFGNTLGGTEDNWDGIKLFDNRYNKLSVPDFSTASLSLDGLPASFTPENDIQVVGIGYDRTEEQYVLVYALNTADTEEIPFSDNRLVVAIYGQDGTFVKEFKTVEECMSLYSRNLLTLTPNNPMVANQGQILLRAMREDMDYSQSLVTIEPDGWLDALPFYGEGFRLSADGNRAFAFGFDDTEKIVSTILELNLPGQWGASLREIPATAWSVEGYGENFTPVDAVMRDNHTYILAEYYSDAYEVFSGLFYWDGEQAELLQILPGRGYCSLAGVGREGECNVMIHGKSEDVPEYADEAEYIKSLIG